MATCGSCQREIIWARTGDGREIRVDKGMVRDGTTFTLDFGAPRTDPPRPLAHRVRRPGVHLGHRLHEETCGQGVPT